MSLIVDGQVDAKSYDKFIEAIASCMGWKIGSQGERPFNFRSRFAHLEIYEVNFFLKNEDKLAITGMLNYFCEVRKCYRDMGIINYPSINVSTAKTPEKIAKEIKSRLLKNYKPEFDKAIAQALINLQKVLVDDPNYAESQSLSVVVSALRSKLCNNAFY